MAEVGTVYQKLVKFLEASGALKPANPPVINEEPDQSASN
jgi:hypothetical protein